MLFCNHEINRPQTIKNMAYISKYSYRTILVWSWFYYSMNSMKLVIPLHFISWKKTSKRCCDTTTPESIHTKDESKCGSAFAFIFGVNWPVQWAHSYFVASHHCSALSASTMSTALLCGVTSLFGFFLETNKYQNLTRSNQSKSVCCESICPCVHPKYFQIFFPQFFAQMS